MAVSLPSRNATARPRTAAAPISALTLTWLAFAASALSACGGSAGGETVQITKTRLAEAPSHVARTGLTMLERAYGPERVASARASAQGNRPGLPPSQNGQNPLLYDVPEGWEDLPRAQFRDINLRLIRDNSAEMVLTFLASDGGGLVPNIDRWRSQVGMEPMTTADVQALTTRKVFGDDATYVELFGPYQGMRGPRIDDGGIFGAIFSRGGGTLFVKMTGSREVLEAEREHFHEFLSSLDINQQARQSSQGSNAAAGGGVSPLVWTAPSGWVEDTTPRQFREATFRKGEIEMYISAVRGTALDNITRWAGQIGQPPLDAAALAALERVEMMGRSGYIYEAEGSMRGMGAATATPGQGLLAALVEGSGQIVTVKLTGKAADVRAAREDFMALVTSIQARQAGR